MTQKERELMIRIRQQQVMGAGMFLENPEFKAWVCNTYDIDEARLTQLQKEVLES